MARRTGNESASLQAPDAPAPGPDLDRQPHKPGIALPADLGRSLRLLDDAQLDRLTKAATDEVRRRGRNPPDSPSVAGRSAKPTPANAARAKSDEPVRAAMVTPGQERLILSTALDDNPDLDVGSRHRSDRPCRRLGRDCPVP